MASPVNPASFAIAFIVFGLAVYRMARIVSTEEGPFELFKRWRDFLFKRYGNHWIVTGFHCHFCCSFYIAIPAAVYLGLNFYLTPIETAALWFALSGFASWLFKQER